MTKTTRAVALATCLLYSWGIAAQAAPRPQAEPPAGTAELAFEFPVGIVTDPEVLAALAELARLRALEKGLRAPAERSLLPPHKLLSSDPYFPSQWHLQNTGQDACEPFSDYCEMIGTPGIDVNVVAVWDDYTGAGQTVAIFETGVEVTHPDFVANYDLLLGDGPGDNPSHGTAVTGVVAAEESNFLGGVGIAFDATVSRIGLAFDDDNQPVEMIAEWATVATRSGGGFFADEKQYLALQGRGGLGTVNFQSAGNGRASGHSISVAPNRGSRYAIVVGSIDAFGNFSTYSNPGPSLLVMTPGEFLITTVLEGTGIDGGDYSFFFGTSAAAPVAAGTAALVLEANPGLGYRDVQEIFAYSARQTDGGVDPSWSVNGARNWNGGGLFTSLDYGFGLLDAHAAVRLAETWPRISTAANESRVEMTSIVSRPIPDGGSLSETIAVSPGGDMDIDSVEVRLDLSHLIANVEVPDNDEVADLSVWLQSPSGTESYLLIPLTDLNAGYGVIFRADDPLPSVQLWGENGAGDWTLTIDDEGIDGVTSTLDSWTLTLYGDPVSDDDIYVFTDTFAGFTAPEDAARRLLQDTGGRDTLNAVAVSGDSVLDLRPGANSTIAGNSLTIAAGTEIEDAAAGDGDDQLLGNDLGNVLRAGRGNDTVDGGAGYDVAVFAGQLAGYDIITMGGSVQVADLWPDVDGDEGTDELTGIELLRFQNTDVPLGEPPTGAFVDQEYDDVDGSGGLEVTDQQTVAQTFTAGFDGTLVGVEIPRIRRHRCDETEDLIFELVTTTGGAPSSTVLARVVVPPAAVASMSAAFGSLYFDLETFVIGVELGDVLGIVLSTSSPSGGCTYIWDGDDFGVYPGGQAFINGGANPRDMGFRTFVLPANDEPPIPAFTVACNNFRKCTFNASDSSDDFGIGSYTWDFGDGTQQVVITEPTIGHRYPQKGDYTATLTVTDIGEQSASVAQTAPVSDLMGAFVAILYRPR